MFQKNAVVDLEKVGVAATGAEAILQGGSLTL